MVIIDSLRRYIAEYYVMRGISKAMFISEAKKTVNMQ